MSDAENVEIVKLGEFDPEKQSRSFDAVNCGCYWRGIIAFESWSKPNEGRIYVYSDRDDPLGDDYAIRTGSEQEVSDDNLAMRAIAAAVPIFDHTTTIEALSDGNGGWIPLQTDT